MKKLLMVAAVAMLGVTAPMSAHADGNGYVGTCRISTLNDTTPGGVLGGQRVWNGQINLAVAASTPGASITAADCYIKVTDGGSQIKMPLDVRSPLPAPAAFGGGRATFTADVDDTVYICTHVTTTATAETNDCAPLTTTPVCPEQACGDGAPLGRYGIVDETLCPVLASLAGTVNSLPTSGVLYIDPASGDTWVGGRTPDDLFWDCDPYVL